MVSGNISGGDVEEYVVIDEPDVSKIASDEDSVAMKNKFSKDWFFWKVSQMAALADPAVIFSKSVHHTPKFIR